MAYPSLEQYNEALAAPQHYLLDPALKTATVKMTGLGLPLALCGGFALTYTVTAGGKRYAIRCFHKEAPELERRYQAISARLKQLSSPYFLPFDFISKGIRIQGKEYPIVKMEWASGETLSEFLEREHQNPTALNRLRGTLAKLAAYLERERIAHGDIQPGNLMVSQGGTNVQLIDYDGMFVESLRGSQATELGQLNFQHPKRSKVDFNETLDRFSFLALDVALQTLATDPSIWRKSQSDPDAVVFRRNDYLAPGASNIFKEVLRLSSVQAAAKNLAQVASGQMGQIPSLADFAQQRGIPQISVSFTTSPQAVHVAYQGPYPVLNATNYAAVLGLVGSKIELVGQIHSVRKLYMHGRHFIFVNFSNWLGQAVKLSIWSDGLNALGNEVPTEAWVGKWVTVSGLVDEPYQGNSRGRPYTHVSITITQRGQIQTLTESEAKFRLGAGSQPTAAPQNSEVLRNMGGTARTAPKTALQSPSTPPVAPKSGNQTVVDQMRKQTPPAPTATAANGAKRSQPSYSGSQKQSLPKQQSIRIGTWVLILFIVAAALRACAG
jgi:hypothetical protein